MDDQRRRPDPTTRPDHSSPDAYELAVQRGAQAPGPEEAGQAPPLPRLHVGPFRVGPVGLLVGVLLLVVVGGLVRFGADRTPPLPRSCTQDGLALSAARVQPGGLVEYSVSGPDGEVLLTVVPRSTDPATARPVQVLPTESLTRCRATGRFGVQAPPGEHSVLVRRAGGVVAVRDLTVTEPGDPTAG